MTMATLAARLTPPGKAAIATIGVRGPAAWELARALFQPARGELPTAPTPGRVWFGRFGLETRDEVVLAARPASIEVHCHGGTEAVRWILELLAARGATVVDWQAYLGPTAPLAILVAHAPTMRTAAILLDQLNGAWDRAIVELKKSSGEERSRLVARLADLIPLGQRLVEPWRVVIAGAPNVGKSSLVNAIAGFTRSVVSPTPGTTRDAVTARVAIDGWPILLTDTAGIRETSSNLEQQGIERACQAVAEADLKIWVLDGACPDSALTRPADDEWLYAINKIDLPPAWDWARIEGAVHVSAQTQAGVAELCDVISRRLVANPPAPGEAMPCLPEQVAWVRSASARDGPLTPGPSPPEGRGEKMA